MGKWIIKAASATVASGALPPAPGDVTLGTPKLDWELIGDEWHAVITVPITPPADPEFDRMIVVLQAPDDAVPTEKATIPDGDLPGFYVEDNPANASRLVSISEPEAKQEVKYNPEEPVIRVSHREPTKSEQWRIIVASGSQHITNAVNRADGPSPTPSVLVTVTPHPTGALGEEHCPNARNVGVSISYFNRRGAEQYWRPKVTWVHPTENPRYDAIAYWDIEVFNPLLPDLPDTPQDDRFVIASTEARERTQWTGLDDWRVPDTPTTFEFWVRPKTEDGRINTRVQNVTGSVRVTVQRQPGNAGRTKADPVLNFDAVASYRIDPTTGRKQLGIDCTWTRPEDPRYGGVVIYMHRSDYPEQGYVPQTGLMVDESTTIFVGTFPEGSVTATLRAFSADADGDVDPSDYVVSVTPEKVLNLEPPSVAVPVGQVTGFSVAAVYLSADYYGKTTLKLTPTFTKPDDPSWAYAEFWAQREDGVWYLLGYPSLSGSFSIVEHLPAVTHTWNFKMVSQDVDSRNRDGDVDTDPTNFPAGSASFALSIPAPNSQLDGSKIQGIPAAAFAAGLTGTYLGTSLPGLPNALYPTGTPFVLTATTPPKLYRVNNAGTGWTAQTDGGDIIARTIVGGSLVVGAVGTVELAATEILVGPGSQRPVRFVVRALDSTLLCLIGDDPSIPFQGLYARNIKIAPGVSSTDKYITADGSGIVMRNVILTNVISGVRFEIGNVITLPFYGTQAGVRVCADSNTNESVLIGSRHLIVTNGSTGNRSLSGDSVGGFGVWNVFNASGNISAQLHGDFGSVFGADGFFGLSNLRLLHGQRAAPITAPSGGGVQDAEARTAINQIIDRLKNHHQLWT